MNKTMEINGFNAAIHTPAALLGEGLNALPPRAQRPAYKVDEYPACPESWMHGSALASSYFVPVDAGKGMWFDFTANSMLAHHLAVVISVQGVNPVTGPTKKDQPAELRLEQYKERCPRHNCVFKQDRFCKKCKYKWPAQNYLATTTGQTMWIDGFRNEKGEVRQYVLTEDDAKGVAAQLIGNNRVFAIGFAFYESVDPRPAPPAPLQFDFAMPTISYLVPPYNGDPSGQIYGPLKKGGPYIARKLGGNYSGQMVPDQNWVSVTPDESQSFGMSGPSGSASLKSMGGQHTNSNHSRGMSSGIGGSSAGHTHDSYESIAPQAMNFADSGPAQLRSTNAVQPATPAKVLEVGMGARINQEIGVDNNPIEFWKPEPSGLIYVNYVSQAECDRILKAGKRKDKKDGAFSGVESAI